MVAVAWGAARRILRRLLPARYVAGRQLQQLCGDSSFGLFLQHPIRRKIVQQLLVGQNEWQSISTLAAGIRENKATVQDHLELLAREGLLLERRFMNKRLFRLRAEFYAPYDPDVVLLAEVGMIGVLLGLHLLRQSELTAGLVVGALLLMAVRRFLQASKA